MLKKGDRVYHRSINGNGLIVRIDESKIRDKYGVVFNWLAHKSCDFHDLDGTYPRKQCRWCSEDELTPSQMPADFMSGKVSLMGNRSLERLIRRITRIRRTRDVYDETQVVINYGAGTSYLPENVICLNENSSDTYDKYIQCRIMDEAGVPVPQVEERPDEAYNAVDGDWIVKPHYGMGGQGIELWDGENHHGKFLQEKVNKVREFRVHVALWYRNQAYLIQEKRVIDTSQLCWNKKQGSITHYLHEPHLGKPWGEDNLRQKLEDIAIRACKALNLDFGGVDLALCEDGSIQVFEVNTRCGLLERTFSIFKKVVWALHDMSIEQWKEYMEHRFDLKLSELEDIVTDEEREAMLEAGRKVTFPAMLADSEVQYA
jgi:hypothetical protein